MVGVAISAESQVASSAPPAVDEEKASESPFSETPAYKSTLVDSNKDSAEANFSQKTSGSQKSQKGGISMAASVLSVKSALSSFTKFKGTSDAEPAEVLAHLILIFNATIKNLTSPYGTIEAS
jgi:hypothetical protein